MGHCNSSAQLSSEGRLRAYDGRVVKTAPSGVPSFRWDWQIGIGSLPKTAAVWILLLFVRFYITFLSPFFGGACKFQPSCSNYAYEAIRLHGARRGLSLAIKRLLRCRPFTKGGFDPVPEPAGGVILAGEVRGEAP